MADFRARQRVQIHDGTNEFGVLVTLPIFSKVSNGTVALDLVTINAAFGAAPVVIPIAGKYQASPTTYDDGDAVPLLTDANGRLLVTASLSINYEFTDDAAFTPGTSKVAAIGAMADEAAPDSVDEGDIGIPRMTLDRKMLVRIVGATDSFRWNIDTNGRGPIDIAAQSLTAVKVSKDAAANSELNPIYVQVVSGVVSGDEIHNYDTSSAVAKDGTDNHDYPVTSAKTFLLKSIIVASSGAMKITLSVGPVAGLVTKAVIFTSGAKPTEQIYFDPPIEVPDTSTGTIRLARRNDDNAAMDVYSTIIGVEV